MKIKSYDHYVSLGTSMTSPPGHSKCQARTRRMKQPLTKLGGRSCRRGLSKIRATKQVVLQKQWPAFLRALWAFCPSLIVTAEYHECSIFFLWQLPTKKKKKRHYQRFLVCQMAVNGPQNKAWYNWLRTMVKTRIVFFGVTKPCNSVSMKCTS